MFLLFVYLSAHVLSGTWLDLFKKQKLKTVLWAKAGEGGEVAQSNLVN